MCRYTKLSRYTFALCPLSMARIHSELGGNQSRNLLRQFCLNIKHSRVRIRRTRPSIAKILTMLSDSSHVCVCTNAGLQPVHTASATAIMRNELNNNQYISVCVCSWSALRRRKYPVEAFIEARLKIRKLVFRNGCEMRPVIINVTQKSITLPIESGRRGRRKKETIVCDYRGNSSDAHIYLRVMAMMAAMATPDLRLFLLYAEL